MIYSVHISYFDLMHFCGIISQLDDIFCLPNLLFICPFMIGFENFEPKLYCV